MKMYFDLDGVIRNIHDAVMDIPVSETKEWYVCNSNGMSFMDIVNGDLHLLFDAEPTIYYPVIREYSPITILTCQPDSWRPYAERWIKKYFDNYKIIYVDKMEDKEHLLGPGDKIVEDYPHFSPSMHEKLIMISYPYNLQSGCFARITEPRQLKNVLDTFYIDGRM